MSKGKNTDNSNKENEDLMNGSAEEQADSKEDISVVEAENSDNTEKTDGTDDPETSAPEKKSKPDLFKILRIICAVGFVVFTALFINEVFIQPYRANQVINKTRDLYKAPEISIAAAPTTAPEITADPDLSPVPTQDPNRDEQGRLLQFKDLLEANADTKGWIKFSDTNIDYAVMQRKEDADYYLTHDFNGDKQKAGCLYLDPRSSVEKNTKNLVIHGHNMKSTDNMFHYLERMKKDINYFKEHTVFSFDTLYQTGQWKVFSVFITNGSDKKEPFFDYMKSTFKDSSEFMNFVYQLRIRSIYNLDQVDINEDDSIVTLSTCSYEINDYRLVIVARKIREGEEAVMDPDLIIKNKNALYPQSYYDNYGNEAPNLPATFEEALDQGVINWYKAPADKE